MKPLNFTYGKANGINGYYEFVRFAFSGKIDVRFYPDNKPWSVSVGIALTQEEAIAIANEQHEANLSAFLEDSGKELLNLFAS